MVVAEGSKEKAWVDLVESTCDVEGWGDVDEAFDSGILVNCL
jgi:hypothetical protein